MGKCSYALYVFHPYLLGFFNWKQTHLRGTVGFVLYFLVCFTAAWLSWHLYEKHFLRLKRYFQDLPKPKRQESLTVFGMPERKVEIGVSLE